MKKNNVLLLQVLLLFISACTPSKYFIDPSFNEIESNSTLIVAKLNEIDISQSFELFSFEDLKTLRNSFFEYQNKYLPNQLKTISKFENVTSALYKSPPQFEKKLFVVNPKENVEVMIPKSPLQLELQGMLYILFFQDYKIAFELEETDTSDPAKHFTSEKLPGLEPQLSPSRLNKLLFTIRCKYFFYDNHNGKVIIAGNAIVKEPYRPEMNLENKMIEAVNGLAERIIAKTPFQK